MTSTIKCKLINLELRIHHVYSLVIDRVPHTSSHKPKEKISEDVFQFQPWSNVVAYLKIRMIKYQLRRLVRTPIISLKKSQTFDTLFSRFSLS